jgi:hypothetical protein
VEEDDSMRLNGQLMGWKDGVLVVNFSEDLVRFLREFRQLDELGFDLPKASNGRYDDLIYYYICIIYYYILTY